MEIQSWLDGDYYTDAQFEALVIELLLIKCRNEALMQRAIV